MPLAHISGIPFPGCLRVGHIGPKPNAFISSTDRLRLMYSPNSSSRHPSYILFRICVLCPLYQITVCDNTMVRFRYIIDQMVALQWIWNRRGGRKHRTFWHTWYTVWRVASVAQWGATLCYLLSYWNYGREIKYQRKVSYFEGDRKKLAWKREELHWLVRISSEND